MISHGNYYIFSLKTFCANTGINCIQIRKRTAIYQYGNVDISGDVIRWSKRMCDFRRTFYGKNTDSLFQDVFIYLNDRMTHKEGGTKRGRQRKISYVKCVTSQIFTIACTWIMLKPGCRNSAWVSHLSNRNPRTCTIISCLPGALAGSWIGGKAACTWTRTLAWRHWQPKKQCIPTCSTVATLDLLVIVLGVWVILCSFGIFSIFPPSCKEKSRVSKENKWKTRDKTIPTQK